MPRRGRESETHPFPAFKVKTGVSSARPGPPIKVGASLIKLIWHAIPAASGGKASNGASQHLVVAEVGQALLNLRAALKIQAYSGKGWGLMGTTCFFWLPWLWGR